MRYFKFEPRSLTPSENVSGLIILVHAFLWAQSSLIRSHLGMVRQRLLSNQKLLTNEDVMQVFFGLASKLHTARLVWDELWKGYNPSLMRVDNERCRSEYRDFVAATDECVAELRRRKVEVKWLRDPEFAQAFLLALSQGLNPIVNETCAMLPAVERLLGISRGTGTSRKLVPLYQVPSMKNHLGIRQWEEFRGHCYAILVLRIVWR